jgi:hypothetical protein
MKTSKASVKKARSYSARQVIKDNNKAFEKMSSAEKRIQIARDTIFQLNAGKPLPAVKTE